MICGKYNDFDFSYTRHYIELTTCSTRQQVVVVSRLLRLLVSGRATDLGILASLTTMVARQAPAVVSQCEFA